MKCFVSDASQMILVITRSKRIITVSNEASKVTAYDAVPCSTLPAVKLPGR